MAPRRYVREKEGRQGWGRQTGRLKASIEGYACSLKSMEAETDRSLGLNDLLAYTENHRLMRAPVLSETNGQQLQTCSSAHTWTYTYIHFFLKNVHLETKTGREEFGSVSNVFILETSSTLSSICGVFILHGVLVLNSTLKSNVSSVYSGEM